MAQRYFIELAYDGSNYHGWQIQPDAISIQEELQKALSMMLREEVKVVGCGRTDAGVHARFFVAHIDLQHLISDTEKLIYKINNYISKAIVIYRIYEVDMDMHARFSATSRSYEYHLLTQKSPFLNTYSYRSYYALDFEKMNHAALELLRYTDFTSFSKLNTDTFTNDCDVSEAFWRLKGEHQWVFHITANRFLHNMVRAIVGTLFNVGKGKLSTMDFCSIIEAKDRSKAGTSAPANALFLTNIKYPIKENIKE